MNLDVQVDGRNCWPDLRDRFIVGQWVGIARLADATILGKTSVTVRIELPDGRTVLAETTLQLLQLAMAAFNAAEEEQEGE